MERLAELWWLRLPRALAQVAPRLGSIAADGHQLAVNRMVAGFLPPALLAIGLAVGATGPVSDLSLLESVVVTATLAIVGGLNLQLGASLLIGVAAGDFFIGHPSWVLNAPHQAGAAFWDQGVAGNLLRVRLPLLIQYLWIGALLLQIPLAARMLAGSLSRFVRRDSEMLTMTIAGALTAAAFGWVWAHAAPVAVTPLVTWLPGWIPEAQRDPSLIQNILSGREWLIASAAGIGIALHALMAFRAQVSPARQERRVAMSKALCAPLTTRRDNGRHSTGRLVLVAVGETLILLAAVAVLIDGLAAAVTLALVVLSARLVGRGVLLSGRGWREQVLRVPSAARLALAAVLGVAAALAAAGTYLSTLRSIAAVGASSAVITFLFPRRVAPVQHGAPGASIAIIALLVLAIGFQAAPWAHAQAAEPASAIGQARWQGLQSDAIVEWSTPDEELQPGQRFEVRHRWSYRGVMQNICTSPGGGPLTVEDGPSAAAECIDSTREYLRTLGVSAGVMNLRSRPGPIRSPLVSDYVAFLGLDRDVAAYATAFAAEASRTDIVSWLSLKFDDDALDERVLRDYLECTRGEPANAPCGPPVAGLTPLTGLVQTGVEIDPPKGYGPISFVVYLPTRVTTEATLTYQVRDDLPPGTYVIGLAGHGAIASLGPQGNESPGWWQTGNLPQIRVVPRSSVPSSDVRNQPPAEAGALPPQQRPGRLADFPELNQWAALGFIFFIAYGGPLLVLTPLGTAVDASGAATGRHPLTNEPLNPAQRILVLVPVIGEVVPSSRVVRPATARAPEPERLARDLANDTVEGYGGVAQELLGTDKSDDDANRP